MKTVRRQTEYHRSERGSNLIELLVAIAIMSFVSAGIMGLTFLQWKTTQKTENKTDSINATRVCIERLSRDIRQARSVGDYYGRQVSPTEAVVDPFTGGVTTDLSVFHPRNVPAPGGLTDPSFPAFNDPWYAPGELTIPGWQPAQSPWTLSSTTLIVQSPVFGSDGFPLAYRQGVSIWEVLDTIVYQVVPDPDSTAQQPMWMMQAARFPAETGKKSTQATTILRHIIGPLNANGQPQVFQYLLHSRADGSAAYATDPDFQAADVGGVVINLEILKAGHSQSAVQSGGQQAVVGFRTEVYLRNNTLATLVAE